MKAPGRAQAPSPKPLGDEGSTVSPAIDRAGHPAGHPASHPASPPDGAASALDRKYRPAGLKFDPTGSDTANMAKGLGLTRPHHRSTA